MIVDRRGHYVTLTVKSEEGVGEISEDKVMYLSITFSLYKPSDFILIHLSGMLNCAMIFLEGG